MKILIVVDMQNDFVDGALGTPEAKAIIPNIFGKIKEYCDIGKLDKSVRSPFLTHNNSNVRILFTKDTHYKATYSTSEEGINLPVPHCLYGTHGHKLISEFDYFKKYAEDFIVIEKETFGSGALFHELHYLLMHNIIESIELVGLCTDICVISNAIIAKSALPNIPIYVDANCCAGTTPEAHQKAIELMRDSLQIHIIE